MDNVSMNDPADFKPAMKAVIVDCRGEETEFEILPPGEDGLAKVEKVGLPPSPPPPPPSSPTLAHSEQPNITPQDLIYPIGALGNCASAETCKAYCDKAENIERCVAFAEEKGLLTKDEVEKGKKFAKIVNQQGGGPGGCKTEAECKDYCNDVSRMDECVKFAEDNGFVAGKELEEMKKVQAAVKSGA